MSHTKPVYLLALLAAIAFFVYLKLSNPNREYSTREYWAEVTLSSVSDVPDDALQAGNKNGPVIMWAAIAASDPAILEALQDRGSDINESDGIFKGTPLTGAAGYSQYPAMISKLIRLGADINKTVHNDETALMIAARYNENPGIIDTLISHGADPNHRNADGKTALDLAIESKNEIAVNQLRPLRQN